MRKKLFIATIFFLAGNILNGQSYLPVLKTNKQKLSYDIGNEYYNDRWNISPELNPDILNITIKRKTSVAFVSECDSLMFIVKPGEIINFIVLQNGTIKTNTQIKAERDKVVKKAKFTKKYKKENNGKTFVEIPEVYELFQIILALTPTGKNDNSIIQKETEYYKSVLNQFDKYKNEKIVSIIDSLIIPKLIFHCELKLDAYSFEFNDRDKIVQSNTYNITSRENTNTLKPYIQLLQDFADKTNFRKFYNENKQLYQSQISFYKDSADVGGMHNWLGENFPGTDINAFKIIFSPLVYGWQNANTISNNGYTEVFAHVNFPYYKSRSFSPASNVLIRGNAIFTEFNHYYIGTTSERFNFYSELKSALGDLSKWIDYSKTAKNYNNPGSCFDEYMNWGLVSLWFFDKANQNEAIALISENEEWMSKGRGFIRFKEFDTFLIALYKNKKPNETITDLYPRIIKWFEIN
ncbi:MAG: hypothetical protein ACD_79C00434G0001 [uncultured bacterium]|nr:MAG: hypothetical protein ACD_79C00434G0001 [uncultured bacterium]